MSGAELPNTGPRSMESRDHHWQMDLPQGSKISVSKQKATGRGKKKNLKESLYLKYALFSFKNSRIPSSLKEEASTETSSLFFALVQEENTLKNKFL